MSARVADRLGAFACAHDHRANVVIHAAGVPLLALALGTALGLLRLDLGPVNVTAADLAWLAASAVWVRLDGALGVATALAALPVLLLADHLAGFGAADGLLGAIAFAVLGSACEVAGHRLEGSAPACRTDPSMALLAPFFLVASLAFELGLRETLADAVDHRVRERLPAPEPRLPT